ncbi:MAG: hypothetical protein JW825_01410 [Candidatus Methanofastidiosa archaeon]|nr:hypothetical protein [Candidatus Methanofastidiosa archaeon]
MNKYSYVLVLIAFIIFMAADYINDKLVYLAFVIFIFAFFLPMIITMATGKHFRGN